MVQRVYPQRPALILADLQLRSLSPPLRASRIDSLFLCTHAITNTPVTPDAASADHFTPSRRPSSLSHRLGVHIALFEAYSVFILIMVCVLADSASRNLWHRRLRALLFPAPRGPTASGWSNSCRVGYLPPTGSTCPFHGARESRVSLFDRGHPRNSHDRRGINNTPFSLR